MVKRGRRRKAGERYPSGDLKGEYGGITATALQRLRSLGTHPMLETEVGRLLFLDELTPLEATTAFRIAEIYGRYDWSVGRRRSVASPVYEMGRQASAEGADSEFEERRRVQAKKDFSALAAILRVPGRGLRAAIEELCVDNRFIPPTWRPPIRAILHVVALELGLRQRRYPVGRTARKPNILTLDKEAS